MISVSGVSFYQVIYILPYFGDNYKRYTVIIFGNFVFEKLRQVSVIFMMLKL